MRLGAALVRSIRTTAKFVRLTQTIASRAIRRAIYLFIKAVKRAVHLVTVGIQRGFNAVVTGFKATHRGIVQFYKQTATLSTLVSIIASPVLVIYFHELFLTTIGQLSWHLYAAVVSILFVTASILSIFTIASILKDFFPDSFLTRFVEPDRQDTIGISFLQYIGEYSDAFFRAAATFTIAAVVAFLIVWRVNLVFGVEGQSLTQLLNDLVNGPATEIDVHGSFSTQKAGTSKKSDPHPKDGAEGPQGSGPPRPPSKPNEVPQTSDIGSSLSAELTVGKTTPDQQAVLSDNSSDTGPSAPGVVSATEDPTQSSIIIGAPTAANCLRPPDKLYELICSSPAALKKEEKIADIEGRLIASGVLTETDREADALQRHKMTSRRCLPYLVSHHIDASLDCISRQQDSWLGIIGK